MGHLDALLNEIRRRPGMYLGAPSVTRLAAFLRGYDLAAERCGGEPPDPFLAEVRDWVHQRYGSTKESWEDTILRHSSDESDALRRFWELLDEFHARPGASVAPPAGRQAG